MAAEAKVEAIAIRSPVPQALGRWGERIVRAGDLDGDGIQDFFIAAPGQSSCNLEAGGRVYAVSGNDLAKGKVEILYVLDSPDPQVRAFFGFGLCVPGDLDGDGINDVAVGALGQQVGRHEKDGKLWVFSGATGRLLYGVENPHPLRPGRHWAEFGSRIASAGDLDGDGSSELMVGAPGDEHGAGAQNEERAYEEGGLAHGRAFIFHGRTGSLMRTLEVPVEDLTQEAGCTTTPFGFGLSVHTPGDTDGDGFPEHLVSAPGYNQERGRMYLFNGRAGSLIGRFDSPEPQPGGLFGFQDLSNGAIGDIDGDGVPEIYGSGFGQDGPGGKQQGRAWVLNARTAEPLYELIQPDPARGGQFGWSLAPTDWPRVDGPAFFVGCAPHHLPDAGQNGGAYLYRGRDGSLVQSFRLPPEYIQPGMIGNVGPSLGWSVAAAGDLNDHGFPGLIAGAPFTDVAGRQDEGLVFLFCET